MTQALQFSVLFNSLDSSTSNDVGLAGAGADSTNSEWLKQAERFQQILSDEKNNVAAERQDIAVTTKVPAQPSGVTSGLQPDKNMADSNDQIATTDRDNALQMDNVVASGAELPDGNADPAGDLLGLIKKSSFTAEQLEKKILQSTQRQTVNADLLTDKAEPVVDKLHEALISAEQSVGAADVLSEDTDVAKLVSTISEAGKPQPDVTGSATSTTPTIARDVEVAGTGQVDDLTEKINGSNLIPEVRNVAVKGPGSVKTETRQISAASPGNQQAAVVEQYDMETTKPAAAAQQQEQVVAAINSSRAESAELLSRRIQTAEALTPEEDRMPEKTQFNIATSEISSELAKNHKAEVAQAELAAIKLTANSPAGQAGGAAIESKTQANSEVDNPVSRSMLTASDSSAANIQTAAQADTAVRAPLAPAEITGSSAELRTSKQLSQAGTDGSENAVTKHTIDTGQTGGERSSDQGAEQRTFQPVRLEVSLNASGAAQNGTQVESFQQQLARFEAAAVTEAAAVNRDEKIVIPELSARLKQLNLQQQDAAGQLRERVQVMVRQNIQVAEIRLDPAELGQMQIRINLQQEQASVQFIVQQQQAKELLEQQMPRLREMLQQQGIQLGEGQVQQQAKQHTQDERGQRSQASERAEDEPATGAITQQIKVPLSERLVDYYA